ncbi:MAG: hypothetical protein ABII64_01550 [Elusimicrobiota bacterium]
MMNVYIGTFLIALATLSFEVTLIRLLSVVTWYHLSFFAVSTAMLGMTAGATTVFLKPEWFSDEKLDNTISKSCLGFALSIPGSLIILCLIALNVEKTIMSFFALLVDTFACMLPFYFSGIALSAILTKYKLPIGKLYASDLAGASLGCLFVLWGLDIFDAPSLIILCGAIAILAALSFIWNRVGVKKLHYVILSISFVAISIINSSTYYAIRPFFVKEKTEKVDQFYLEKWNSFSRVVVYKRANESPQYWGPSSKAPKNILIPQHRMNIDGEAGTVLRRFSSMSDIEHLRYDIPNVVYFLRPPGKVCVIGAGGGRDIQSALLFKNIDVTGVDINPIFINLLKGSLGEFAGIAKNKSVSLITDEARSYLSRTKEKYSIIQMSLIDTWAATGAGAFSLSENSLYTVEAWKIFTARLSDDGIFTVSRWHNPENLGETGRVVSLAVASLLESGVTDYRKHIAMLTNKSVSTLLLSRNPFGRKDIQKIINVADTYGYDKTIIPGEKPKNEVLAKILSSRSKTELAIAIADEPLNYTPTTDENPYFFNMLKLDHIGYVLSTGRGILKGNLLANLTLAGLVLSLFVLAILTIVLPLKFKTGKKDPVLWQAAVYFSLIGAGFMFTEIALIQKMSVFLGHPTYALGILLFTIIASSGCGSYLSEKIPLTTSPWMFIYPVTTALAILAIRFILPVLMSEMVSSSMINKIFASVIIIFPLGMLMGVCFPTGMRFVRLSKFAETPWYWALNGIFGVLCSALTVFISIYLGISVSFYLAVVCYLLLLPCLPAMHTWQK